MIVSITGHRPDKLGGYYVPNAMYNSVMKGLSDAFDQLKPSLVITGMALGVDQWAAELCILKGIPFLAAVPFDGQESIWPDHAKERYKFILSRAASVYILNPGPFKTEHMHFRNRWMVDNSDVLLATYDGTPGGTRSCIDYAMKKGKKIAWTQFDNAFYAEDGSIKNKNKYPLAKSETGAYNLLALGEPTKFKKVGVKFKPAEVAVSNPVPTAEFIKKIKEKASELAQSELQNAKDKAYALNEAATILAKAEAEKESALKAKKKAEKAQKELQKKIEELQKLQNSAAAFPQNSTVKDGGIEFKQYKRVIKLDD